jgi:hypothetical protein
VSIFLLFFFTRGGTNRKEALNSILLVKVIVCIMNVFVFNQTNFLSIEDLCGKSILLFQVDGVKLISHKKYRSLFFGLSSPLCLTGLASKVDHKNDTPFTLFAEV